MKKKRAFTMVELIFVIVILGILAAVAVPRLNKSREDAEAAKLATHIRNYLKDLQTFYTANGSLNTPETARSRHEHYVDIAKLTNVPLTPSDSSPQAEWIEVGGAPCLMAFAWTNLMGYDKLYGMEFASFIIKKDQWDANEMCQRVLKRDEIKALLNGRSSNGELYTERNLVNAYLPSKSTTYIYIPLNDGAVEFD